MSKQQDDLNLREQAPPAYGGGFMGGLMGVLGPHIEQQHQLGLENKKKLAQPYWDAAMASAQKGYDLHNQYTEAQAKGASKDVLDGIEQQIAQAEQDHTDFMAQYTKTVPGGNNPNLKDAIGKIGHLFKIGKSARSGSSGMGIMPPPGQVRDTLAQGAQAGQVAQNAQPAPAEPAVAGPAAAPDPSTHTLAPPPALMRAAGATYGQAQNAANIVANRQMAIEKNKQDLEGVRNLAVADARAEALKYQADARVTAVQEKAAEDLKKADNAHRAQMRKMGQIATKDSNTGEWTYHDIPESELTPQERANIKKTTAQGNQAQAAADRPAAETPTTLALKAAHGDKIAERAMKLLKPGESTSLTTEAIGMLGQMFAMTGVLPSMGMGAKADRELVFNEAANNLKESGTDLASQQAAYKANQTALTKQVTMQAAINSFEATAKENLNRALDTAKKIVDSGSPLLNQPLRLIDEKVLGSNELAAFRTARQVAINEVAKITSNPNLTGTLSDSARHEVESLVSEDATLGQIYAAADILVKDMDSRKQNTDATVEALKGQIKQLGQKASNGAVLAPPPIGMINVQIPGQPVGHIQASQWDAFKKKYPNAEKK